jgi:hypothetical protein
MQNNTKNDNDKNINESTSKASLCKNFSISNSNIFIGARQNLKAQNIRLINHSRYNNTVHREITNFRNKKSTSVDKVNIQLVKNENFDQIEQIDVIKMMNVRWWISFIQF